MSAEPIEPPHRRDFRDATPDEIRAALIPEEQVEFDQTWRRALLEAIDTRDLTGVYETLDDWRQIAWMTTASGPRAHRQMWRRAAAAHAGEDIPADEPFAVTKARLGY
jgi:Family of unknown function (DUF6247)